ncbi:MAG: 16S rRNA processing protein RimM [Firmicutes bacterium]|nr:16S rRNA processing protein RimM [Bacillota bacterium]
MTPNAGSGVTLARLLGARGRRGEVAAEILTDFPERLTHLPEVWLVDPHNEALPPRRVSVRRCWLHRGRAMFHFEGCNSIADAERLRGLEVRVPLEQRAPLPSGMYFVSDLIGCEVYEMGETAPAGQGPVAADRASVASSNALLGLVREVLLLGKEVPGTPLLVVETTQGELLIPFAEEICRKIDVVDRRIEVRLPEGLREINQ